MPVRILAADDISSVGLDVLRDAGYRVKAQPGIDGAALRTGVRSMDALLVRSRTRVPPSLLDAAPRLRLIGRAGFGMDTIDVEAATERGVAVVASPEGNATTASEFVIGLIFNLARHIPRAHEAMRQRKWEKRRFRGMEVSGKTLGVIGCGNIGAIVCDRAIGLKMKVAAYDPFLSDDRARDLGVEKVELDELLARADFITLHTPLTDTTRGIIDKEALAKTKKGVRIINCARGGLVVEEDLKQAIEDGQVAGAAVDVFENEPAKENVLFGMENVVATPHLGAATDEAQENVALQVAEQMSDYLLTGAVTNALNMASVSAEEAPRLKPYFELARQMGSFAGQLTTTALKSVHIEYRGQAASLNTRPLTAIVLEGLLSPLMDTVNMVNAPVIAKQRNIDVRETRDESTGAYQTWMRVEVVTERQTRDLCGTLFGGESPRIVQVKGIELEAKLGAHMLYTTNADVPGFIGALGTALGDAGVNIATFHLGRGVAGDDAIALVEVDEPITAKVLEKVRDLPHVVQAEALEF